MNLQFMANVPTQQLSGRVEAVPGAGSVVLHQENALAALQTPDDGDFGWWLGGRGALRRCCDDYPYHSNADCQESFPHNGPPRSTVACAPGMRPNDIRIFARRETPSRFHAPDPKGDDRSGSARIAASRACPGDRPFHQISRGLSTKPANANRTMRTEESWRVR